jgi:hypothetical protein
VAVPAAKKGADVRAFAARTQGALLEANARLLNDRRFYADVLREFGAQ